MLLYAKEFKELFNEEIEGYNLSEEGETPFLFDIVSFEEKNGDILSLSPEKLDLLLSITEAY